MDKEALIRYKFYLCRKYPEKLLDEKTITKAQKAKLESAVLKRLSGI